MKHLSVILLCLIVCCTGVRAQTCTGSLGDPIVHVDFGSGSATYGPPLSSNPSATTDPTTNYPYVAGYPADGYYTIVSNTAVLNHNTWVNTTGPVGNTGYMMVINANATQTSYFYKQIISQLCPNTTYEFAASVLNLATDNTRVKPNLTFSITDAAGNTSTLPTGDIPANQQWIKEGMLFTTPATEGNITLTITNNGPGGNGNDLALDDITFRACGPVLSTQFIATSSQDPRGCAGDNKPYNMTATPTAGYHSPAYQWQTFTNNAWVDIVGATSLPYSVTPTAAGTYQYRITSAEAGNITSEKCRVVSNTLTLTIYDPPSSKVMGGTSVCEGETISLTASTGDSYSWTGPNGFTWQKQQISIPNAVPSQSGTYSVVVTQNGCTTPGTAMVTVYPKVIPTVSSNTTICAGDATQLQASGGVSYSWLPTTGLSDPKIANPIANPADTTTYTVTVTGPGNCSAPASVTVNVIKAPVVDAGKNIVMTEGQTVKLNGSVKYSTNYYWTPTYNLSNALVLQPMASPTSDITYTLHAIGADPCNAPASASVFVRVYKKVVVPNTFTPNGDGVNDTWDIKALDTYPESTTQVFARSGVLVFQSTGYPIAWNGTYNGSPLPVGTYYYKIDLKNGNVMSGWVAIIR